MVADLHALSRAGATPWNAQAMGRFFDQGRFVPPGLKAAVPGWFSRDLLPPLGRSRAVQGSMASTGLSPSEGQATLKTYEGAGVLQFAKPQPGLQKIQVGADGTLYRLHRGRIFRSVGRAVPNAMGQMYIRDGFVGEWKTVERPILSRLFHPDHPLTDFEAKTVGGRDTLFSVRQPLWGTKPSIYKDGRRYATVAPFQEFQADVQGNVYVRRTTPSGDAISRVRPDGKEEAFYTIPLSARNQQGASSFEVAPDGKLYWTQNGGLYYRKPDGTPDHVRGDFVEEVVSPSGKIFVYWDGFIKQVKTDGKGQVYALTEKGSIFLNGYHVFKSPEVLKGAFGMEVDDGGHAHVAFEDPSTSPKSKKIGKFFIPQVTG